MTIYSSPKSKLTLEEKRDRTGIIYRMLYGDIALWKAFWFIHLIPLILITFAIVLVALLIDKSDFSISNETIIVRLLNGLWIIYAVASSYILFQSSKLRENTLPKVLAWLWMVVVIIYCLYSLYLSIIL